MIKCGCLACTVIQTKNKFLSQKMKQNMIGFRHVEYGSILCV